MTQFFVYGKYLPDIYGLIHMCLQVNLQFYSMCSKYLPSTHTNALRNASHWSVTP